MLVSNLTDIVVVFTTPWVVVSRYMNKDPYTEYGWLTGHPASLVSETFTTIFFVDTNSYLIDMESLQ